MYQKLVTAVRLVFGVQMTLSGLNWWVKMTLYPSVSDFVSAPPPHNVLGALVETGFMFHVVKGTELIAGLAMLTNLYVPLVLVVAFPVTAGVFMIDVFTGPHLRGLVMGVGAFTQQVFLMFAYLRFYKPMLVQKAEPDPL